VSTPKSATIRREAKTTGIGISAFPEKDNVLVTYVFEGSPAALVGLAPGDRITAVDGQKISDAVRSIAGDEGTSVVLTVKKATGQEQELTVVRKKYSTVRPEELKLLDEDTAMLTVHTFDLTYNSDRVESLMKKVGSRKNLILDLRGNGGGAVYNLQHLLACFLPAEAEIGTFISRRVVDEYRKETGNYGNNLVDIAKWATRKVRVGRRTSSPRFTGNIAVLVDGGSGSASEMAAAALKELRGASLIGSKTAGAVLVSVIAPVGQGFTLQYPLSDYVTIQGKRLEGDGVLPDSPVESQPFRLPNIPDNAIAKAQEIFKDLALKRG
jgi:carboxyl-terminal processing protease